MFKPWIGSAYHQQIAPKIFILGESHYGSSPEDKTILCIQQQIDDSWRSKFYTKIVATFIGHKPSLEEKRVFWSSVVFHNLITEPLSKARVSPTNEQWHDSAATLFALVEELKPDYCVCLGYRMWHVLRSLPGFTPVDLGIDVGPCGAYSHAQLSCIFHGIKHPSGRGFRSADWHVFITNLRTKKWANQAPEPTPTTGTPPAGQEARQP